MKSDFIFSNSVKRYILINLILDEMFSIIIKEHHEIYVQAVLNAAKSNPELFKEVTGYAEVQKEDNPPDEL